MLSVCSIQSVHVQCCNLLWVSCLSEIWIYQSSCYMLPKCFIEAIVVSKFCFVHVFSLLLLGLTICVHQDLAWFKLCLVFLVATVANVILLFLAKMRFTGVLHLLDWTCLAMLMSKMSSLFTICLGCLHDLSSLSPPI